MYAGSARALWYPEATCPLDCPDKRAMNFQRSLMTLHSQASNIVVSNMAAEYHQLKDSFISTQDRSEEFEGGKMSFQEANVQEKKNAKWNIWILSFNWWVCVGLLDSGLLDIITDKSWAFLQKTYQKHRKASFSKAPKTFLQILNFWNSKTD